jgi:hypothetical protein
MKSVVRAQRYTTITPDCGWSNGYLVKSRERKRGRCSAHAEKLDNSVEQIDKFSLAARKRERGEELVFLW